MKSIEHSIIEIISKTLLIDESSVARNASLADELHADSLDAVELVMALEERFGIEISDEDAEQLHTVQQVIDYVLRQLNLG